MGVPQQQSPSKAGPTNCDSRIPDCRAPDCGRCPQNAKDWMAYIAITKMTSLPVGLGFGICIILLFHGHIIRTWKHTSNYGMPVHRCSPSGLTNLPELQPFLVIGDGIHRTSPEMPPLRNLSCPRSRFRALPKGGLSEGGNRWPALHGPSHARGCLGAGIRRLGSTMKSESLETDTSFVISKPPIISYPLEGLTYHPHTIHIPST